MKNKTKTFSALFLLSPKASADFQKQALQGCRSAHHRHERIVINSNYTAVNSQFLLSLTQKIRFRCEIFYDFLHDFIYMQFQTLYDLGLSYDY